MGLRSMVAGAAFAAALGCSSAAIAAAEVTVPGTADIFAGGLQGDVSGTPVDSGGNNGYTPPFIYVSPGQTLTITATGSVSCCVGSSTGPTGPAGFSGNPFSSGGSSITSSLGNGVTYQSDNAFELAGLFGSGDQDGYAPVGSAFAIGDGLTGLLVPAGAYRLYLGLPDASGFNGASGYYADNDGSFDVTISGAPEPSTWALMVGGVGFFGLALRSRRRRSTSPMAA